MFSKGRAKNELPPPNGSNRQWLARLCRIAAKFVRLIKLPLPPPF
jgi:hypothetical protein